LSIQSLDGRTGGASAQTARLLVASGRRPDEIHDRHFLFVAAPFGPFSRLLAESLRAEGARCSRIILNAGDASDWGLRDAAAYRGHPRRWPSWVASYLAREQVSDLIVYGDSNPYCVAAMKRARRLGVKIHVLEQGYFRPDWITLERDGVNGTSRLPRDPDYFRQMAKFTRETPYVEVGRIARASVGRIFAYHLMAYLGFPAFPNFRFAYPYSPLLQAGGHIRRYLLQHLGGRRTQVTLDRILSSERPMFLAILQRPGDSQLVKHSAVKTVTQFIGTVLSSFAANAGPEAMLVFKCHPLDHGLEDHRGMIRRLAEACGIADRVVYLDGGDLPAIVLRSQGVISVNSTAGLVGIDLARPTLVLGCATYDIRGMTHQDGLDRFWTQPQSPDPEVYHAYRRLVMATTQINGAYSTARGIDLALPETLRRLLAT
jgi:capsular polysaccharide export protein